MVVTAEQVLAVQAVCHVTIVEIRLRSRHCSSRSGGVKGFVTWVVAVLHLIIVAVAADYCLGIGCRCATGLYPAVLSRTTVISNVSYTATRKRTHHAKVIDMTAELAEE